MLHRSVLLFGRADGSLVTTETEADVGERKDIRRRGEEAGGAEPAPTSSPLGGMMGRLFLVLRH